MGQSRTVILVVVVSLSFIVPGALCFTLAVVSVRSILDLALAAAAVGTWMTLLALVNWWEFTSIQLRTRWLVALALVASYRAVGSLNMPLASPLGFRSLLIVIAWTAGAWAVVNAVRARRPHVAAVDLAIPLCEGMYLVTDGGDGARSFLVNYHYGFGRHRASGVAASMRYAIDMVAIGPGGCESRGFLPRANDAYRIWHLPLKAPCDGRVVHVVDEVADNAAFGADRPYGLGNHVVLRKGADVYVVMGHLSRGSVAVTAGEDVRTGEQIGRVGNSGWTERPHLHMQAMRSAQGDWWHGEPLPLSFNGRFPVRNQVFRG